MTAREDVKYDIPEEWMENKKNNLCPVCAKTKHEFEKRMRVFCSKECRIKYYSKITTWDELRDKTLERQKTTCQKCGLTPKVAKLQVEDRFQKSIVEFVKSNPNKIVELRSGLIKEIEELNDLLDLSDLDLAKNKHVYGMPSRYGNEFMETRFEVDHIVAIVNDGDQWDEKNLQVLCLDCHKIKTKLDMKKESQQ